MTQDPDEPHAGKPSQPESEGDRLTESTRVCTGLGDVGGPPSSGAGLWWWSSLLLLWERFGDCTEIAFAHAMLRAPDQ